MNRLQRTIEFAYHNGLVSVGLAYRVAFADLGPDAARKALDRAAEKGLLRCFKFGPVSYYVLGASACRRLKIKMHHRRGKPLSRQALLNAVGKIHCCLNPKNFATNLSPVTFRERFGTELCQPGLSDKSYYLDRAFTDDAERLGLAIVDKLTTIQNLQHRLYEQIEKRYRHAAWSRLIDAGGFVVAILTASPTKAKDIEEIIRRNPPEGVPFRVVVVPELLNLLLAKG